MKRLSREWVVQKASSNHIGQTNIFLKERLEEDWRMFCNDIDRYFGVTPEIPVPDEAIAKWVRKRCVSRKTKDDWSGIRAMHRDFQSFTGETYPLASFESAIGRAGFAVHHGMISRLILKSDLQMTISEVYGDMLIQ